MIAAHAVTKVFRPPGRVLDLLRGRLYGAPITALAGVSFNVAPGELVCLMGENGAGKSTLLRILSGLLTPTSGDVVVAGDPVITAGATSAFRRRVALVVADERSFFWSLSGRENLLYFAALHGLAGRQARTRSDALVDRMGLREAGDRRFAEYSRGMRQRLALCRGLLGDPEVLLLDEPTLGLDPRGAHDLRHFLRDDVIKGHGRTALVGSNDPAEVRLLGDRVLFLHGGRITSEAAPAELNQHFQDFGLPHV